MSKHKLFVRNYTVLLTGVKILNNIACYRFQVKLLQSKTSLYGTTLPWRSVGCSLSRVRNSSLNVAAFEGV